MARPRQSPQPAPSQKGDAARLVLVSGDATRDQVLYERVAPIVNRIVWLYLATDRDRDDIAQDIFVSIVRGVGSVRDPAQLEGWAARVAYNAIFNVFRRRRLVRWISLEALKDYEPPASQVDFEGRELVSRAQQILEHLPVAQRMPFTLELLGNASQKEIAELCGCSERTLRRRLKAARVRFLRLVQRDPALAGLLVAQPRAKEESSNG